MESVLIPVPPSVLGFKLSKKGLNGNLAHKFISSRATLVRYENAVIKQVLTKIDPLILYIKSGNLFRGVKVNLGEAIVREADASTTSGAGGVEVTSGEASSLAKRLVELIAPYLSGSVAGIESILLVALATIARSQVDEFEKLFVNSIDPSVKNVFSIGTSISHAQIQAAIDTPIGGVKFGDLLKLRYGDTISKIKAAIVQSLIAGEGVDKAAGRVADVVDFNMRRYAATLARTEIHRVANTTNLLLFQQNADIIKNLQFVATLDLRTCLICANLDGKILPMNTEVVPPMHPRCRCILVPVVKSMSELGGEDFDFPDEVRASMDGTVPGRITFDEWFGDLTATQQKEYLGPVRYGLFASGKLKLSDFASVDRVFSLSDLQ